MKITADFLDRDLKLISKSLDIYVSKCMYGIIDENEKMRLHLLITQINAYLQLVLNKELGYS